MYCTFKTMDHNVRQPVNGPSQPHDCGAERVGGVRRPCGIGTRAPQWQDEQLKRHGERGKGPIAYRTSVMCHVRPLNLRKPFWTSESEAGVGASPGQQLRQLLYCNHLGLSGPCCGRDKDDSELVTLTEFDQVGIDRQGRVHGLIGTRHGE